LRGGGGEVCAVDPEPLEVAPAEVRPAIFVAVPEVAAPVPTVADASRVRVVVLVVALEPRSAVLVDDLADARLGVEEPAIVVELGPRALLHRLGVEDDDALGRHAEGTRRHVGTT